MPATAAWDENSPAGTDLASTIDNSMRAMKRDVRERMAVDHIWGVSVEDDGKHQRMSLVPGDNVTPITNVGNTITNPNSGGLLDLKQTWNTTAKNTAFKIDITDTASANDSMLLEFLVNGLVVLGVTKQGVVTTGGSAGPGVYYDLRNINTGAEADAGFRLGNNRGAALAGMYFGSDGHATHPEQLVLESKGNNGILIDSQTGPIVIKAGGLDTIIIGAGGGYTFFQGPMSFGHSIPPPNGGTPFSHIMLGGLLGFGLFYGVGAPVAELGSRGALYMRTDGNSPTTRLYIHTGTVWTHVLTGA